MGIAPHRLALIVLMLASGAFDAMAGVDGCIIYKDRQFQGHQLVIDGNTRMTSLAGDWDDAISSVKVAPLCLLVVFEHKDHQGPAETFGPGEWSQLPEGWDEQVSSLQCNCRQSAPDK